MILKAFLLVFLLTGTSVPAFAGDTLTLQGRYACDEETVYAEDLFPDINTSFVIAEFKNRSRIQLSARKVQALFKTRGFDVEASHPVILLTKASTFDKTPLKTAVEEAFKERYPHIMIRKVTVRARNYFEQDGMRLKEITIPRPNLTKNHGTFTAVYADNAGKEKRLFFSYTLHAEIPVLKAKRNMANGTILSRKNSEEARIPFTSMLAPPLDAASMENVRIRGYVKAGSIITESMVQDIPDIVKNQKVSAVLKESGVRVIIYATAQEDGKIGEMIRLKTDAGRIYNARVIDKNKAEIE